MNVLPPAPDSALRRMSMSIHIHRVGSSQLARVTGVRVHRISGSALRVARSASCRESIRWPFGRDPLHMDAQLHFWSRLATNKPVLTCAATKACITGASSHISHAYVMIAVWQCVQPLTLLLRWPRNDSRVMTRMSGMQATEATRLSLVLCVRRSQCVHTHLYSQTNVCALLHNRLCWAMQSTCDYNHIVALRGMSPELAGFTTEDFASLA